MDQPASIAWYSESVLSVLSNVDIVLNMTV